MTPALPCNRRPPLEPRRNEQGVRLRRPLARRERCARAPGARASGGIHRNSCRPGTARRRRKRPRRRTAPRLEPSSRSRLHSGKRSTLTPGGGAGAAVRSGKVRLPLVREPVNPELRASALVTVLFQLRAVSCETRAIRDVAGRGLRGQADLGDREDVVLGHEGAGEVAVAPAGGLLGAGDDLPLLAVDDEHGLVDVAHFEVALGADDGEAHVAPRGARPAGV